MPATAATPPTTRSRERRAQALVLGLLLALAAWAWWATEARMRGMPAAPGAHLGALGFYVVVWVTMMAAMMFPSLAPMVLAHARVRAARRGSHAGATAAFVVGYLVSWTAYGLAAYALWHAGRAWLFGDAQWSAAGRHLAGGVLVGAAAYQLLPVKDRCLSRCRSPLVFLTDEWREGRLGALVMGALHGAWCVGCCWALMAALFALGVMSLGWMAFITVLIAAEKLLPWNRATTVMVAGILAALGAGVAFSPGEVPGLVEPGAMHHH